VRKIHGGVLMLACLLASVLPPALHAGTATARSGVTVPGSDIPAATLRGSQADPADDIPSYQLAITVNPRTRRLDGHMQLRFTNRTGAPLRDVVLRLYPNFPPDVFGDGGDVRMDLRNVRAEDRPTTVRYEAGRTAARIPLPAPAEPGGEIRIELDWTANIRPWQRSDGTFPLPSYYPMLAAWTGEWRTDSTRFPDHVFVDAANYNATIAVPAGMQVIASGATRLARQANGQTTYEVSAGPVRELAFSVGKWATAHAEHQGIAVNVYHKPGDGLDASARQVALHAAASLAVLGDRIGPYPYAELDFHLINARRGYDIGVEFPGLIYLLVNGRYTGETRFVTAHEVAHQWWYGVVGNDIYREPWIDEAFAQWSAVLVEEQLAGAEAGLRTYRQQVERRAQRSNAPCGMGLTTFGSWNAYYAAVYGRCAKFLQVLRQELGDDAFFAGIRRYYAENKHGFGTSGEVRAALEASSGRNLQRLFKEWTGR